MLICQQKAPCGTAELLLSPWNVIAVTAQHGQDFLTWEETPLTKHRFIVRA